MVSVCLLSHMDGFGSIGEAATEEINTAYRTQRTAFNNVLQRVLRKGLRCTVGDIWCDDRGVAQA